MPFTNTFVFFNDFGVIIISALIFVISFLWKDLLVDIEQIYFPKNKGILNRVIYICVVTILILLIINYLRKFFNIDDNNIKFDDSPMGDIPL